MTSKKARSMAGLPWIAAMAFFNAGARRHHFEYRFTGYCA